MEKTLAMVAMVLMLHVGIYKEDSANPFEYGVVIGSTANSNYECTLIVKLDNDMGIIPVNCKLTGEAKWIEVKADK